MAFVSAAGSAVQTRNQNKAMEQEMGQAVKAQEVDNSLLDLRQRQEQDQASLQKLERDRQTMRDFAKVKVAGAESGAFGNSILKQLSDTIFQGEYDKAIIDQNLDNTLQQTQIQKDAVRNTAEGRINNANARTTSNLLGALKMAEAGMDGYATAQSIGNQINSAKPAKQ